MLDFALDSALELTLAPALAYKLLFLQVEVYQGDFNAEREARERIAGEKADLLDQLDKLRKQTGILR